MTTLIELVNRVRSDQWLITDSRLNDRPLVAEVHRLNFQQSVGALVEQLEFDLAYDYALEVGETCTCTPNSDACPLCVMASKASTNPTIVMMDDIPF